jgi:hypothetical protein
MPTMPAEEMPVLKKLYCPLLVLMVTLVGGPCAPGPTEGASLPGASGAMQSCPPTTLSGAACPRLTLRSPGVPRRLYCRHQLDTQVNGGRPIANTCLLEGFGFTPGTTAHLNYSFSIAYVGFAPNAQQEPGAARRVSTPMPYVRCLMRQPLLCHAVTVDAHGHFGPIWIRFHYLLGDLAQVFTVHGYGGPHERANVDLPWTQVVQ